MNQASKNLGEWLLGGLIIAALVALINPSNLLMSFGVEMGIVSALALATVVFAVYFWREQPADEREAQHGLLVARASYFVVGFVLLLAIVAQCLHGPIDIWLPIALGAMVTTKLIGSTWLRRK